MRDLRTFFEEYSRLCPAEIIAIDQPVDAKWFAAAIATKAERSCKTVPVLVFDRIRLLNGKISAYPAVVNLLSSRRRLASTIGSSFERFGIDLSDKIRQKKKPVVVAKQEAPAKEVVKGGDEVNLHEYPALVQHAWDPGPYITAGFLTCYDPDSGIDNCALQRGWIKREREIRIHM